MARSGTTRLARRGAMVASTYRRSMRAGCSTGPSRGCPSNGTAACPCCAARGCRSAPSTTARSFGTSARKSPVWYERRARQSAPLTAAGLPVTLPELLPVAAAPALGIAGRLGIAGSRSAHALAGRARLRVVPQERGAHPLDELTSHLCRVGGGARANRFGQRDELRRLQLG